MLPARYLYLVEVDTDEPLAIFPIDHLAREGDVILYEAQLRAEHNVDDPASGLVLRDSLLDPLPEGVAAPIHRASASAPPPHET
jgi:hypothetical protein